MLADLAKILEEMSHHDYKIAKQLALTDDCPHCCTSGDNNGESCRHCGKQLKGYGYGGWFGRNLKGTEKCIHDFIPNSFGCDEPVMVCRFCEKPQEMEVRREAEIIELSNIF